MGQSPSQHAPQKGALSAFCCNSNLCNNDSNIDNRMTEVNKKNPNGYRQVMAAVQQNQNQAYSRDHNHSNTGKIFITR